MTYQVGYLTELTGITLDEGDDVFVSTFQAMPYGEYDHPIYGKITLTPEKAQEIANNVNSGVRGQDLDIDYDHKQYGGEAAGWVKGAKADPRDGLLLTVEWTKKAGKLIKEKAYRYFSPELTDEWKHPSTGVVHKNVLFGGGITNRPFLKGILPLNMSEMSLDEHQSKKEGNGMDPKKLRKLLGLPEDATDDQVTEALNKVPDDHVIGPKATEQKPEGEDEGEEGAPEGQSQSIAATEGLSAEVIQLAEKSPAIKALVEAVTGLQKTVEVQGAALQLSEAANKVAKLSEPTKDNRVLPAVVQTQLQEILVSAPKTLSDKITTMVTSLNEAGYVQLGERGESSGPASESTDAIKRFNDEVAKVMVNDKLSIGDATERVASLHPQLFQEYRAESYSFKE